MPQLELSRNQVISFTRQEEQWTSGLTASLNERQVSDWLHQSFERPIEVEHLNRATPTELALLGLLMTEQQQRLIESLELIATFSVGKAIDLAQLGEQKQEMRELRKFFQAATLGQELATPDHLPKLNLWPLYRQVTTK